MRDRGTCEAWKCERDAVGHRVSGFRVLYLCGKHAPRCGVCETPDKPDATGEFRCARCDEAIESMARSDREEVTDE